jgi:hypothetical protein
VSPAQLRYGRKVIWRNLRAEIVDIVWHARGVNVQIRVVGGRQHWTTPAELEVAS